MRTRKEKLGLKKVAFKASKKKKGHKDHDHSNSKSDEADTQFVRMLKLGTRKFKYKISFNYF